jgi:hypothetical protein
MPNIYDQHDKAFQHVSAFVVMHEGKPVAKIAFKFPRDGAGRLYAYVHWIGTQMARGSATGYGYDKRTAAAHAAAAALPFPYTVDAGEIMQRNYVRAETAPIYDRFRYALQNETNGRDWWHRLEHAGFSVFQAV